MLSCSLGSILQYNVISNEVHVFKENINIEFCLVVPLNPIMFPKETKLKIKSMSSSQNQYRFWKKIQTNAI